MADFESAVTQDDSVASLRKDAPKRNAQRSGKKERINCA
jgi:hypothetical protein